MFIQSILNEIHAFPAARTALFSDSELFARYKTFSKKHGIAGFFNPHIGGKKGAMIGNVGNEGAVASKVWISALWLLLSQKRSELDLATYRLSEIIKKVALSGEYYFKNLLPKTLV